MLFVFSASIPDDSCRQVGSAVIIVGSTICEMDGFEKRQKTPDITNKIFFIKMYNFFNKDIGYLFTKLQFCLTKT